MSSVTVHTVLGGSGARRTAWMCERHVVLYSLRTYCMADMQCDGGCSCAGVVCLSVWMYGRGGRG